MNEPQYEVTPNGAIAYKPVPAPSVSAEAERASRIITFQVNGIAITQIVQNAINAATEKLRAELSEWKQAADVEAKCHDETLAKNTLLHESHDALAKEVEGLREALKEIAATAGTMMPDDPVGLLEAIEDSARAALAMTAQNGRDAS